VAIAHDSEVMGAVSTSAGAYTTSITPTNPPKGVCVVITQTGAVTDLVSAVTYGGVALTRLRFDTETTEVGGVYIYWGASSFPTGAQNVVVTRTGTTNMRAAISTMTVGVGQTVTVDTHATGTSPGVANPSWAMTTTVAVTACYLGIHSGLQAMTNTPATNWTLAPTPGFEDIGSQGRGFARRAATSATNQLPGWIAATSEDFVGSSVAFKEVPITQVVNDPIHAANAGRSVNPGRVASDFLNP
jgi:hypothetical protein